MTSAELVPQEITRAFLDLLTRYGATLTPGLEERAARALVQLVESLGESANDGKSLTPLDVARIRLGKFAATVIPPRVFQEQHELIRLRAEIAELARVWLSDESGKGSRFALPKR